MDWRKMIGRKVKTPSGRYGTIVARGDEPHTYDVRMGAGEHHVYHVSDMVLVPIGSKLTLEQLSVLDDARVACADLQVVIEEYIINESGAADLASAAACCHRAVETLNETIPELLDDPGVPVS